MAEVVAHAIRTSTELLERDRELLLLGESLEAVQSSGHGSVVVISGEAGVGKTALLRQFFAAPGDSLRVLWGACDPLFTPRPLGPILDIAESTGGEVQELVTAGAAAHEVVAGLMRELRRRPTVLVLEDVHWADEATLDVLRLLARKIEDVPALVVVTNRDDELDRRHPLRVVLGELATSLTVNRVRLEPLSLVAVTQLAERHGVDADELYRTTAGNPFFIAEVLATGGDEMPQSVRDAVLARAGRLGAGAQSVLEATAVTPQHAELWLLDALADDAGAYLDECLASGMLTSEAGGVAFRHELARLAVEQSIGPGRARELHQRALAALAEPPEGSADPARLAHHAEAAGDAAAVRRYAPAAGKRAAGLSAHREAAAQYARALRFADDLSPTERADLLERRAEAAYFTDQHDEAIAALDEALECHRVVGDRLREGDVLRKLSQYHWCPGRTVEAERFAREAVALLETLPPSRELAMAYCNLASTCSAAAQGWHAVTWASCALEAGELLGDTEIVVHALATIGAWERPPRAKLAESLERARAAGLAEQVGRAYVLLAELAVDERRPTDAERYLAEGIEFCSDLGFELYRFYLLASRARGELDQGRWTDAADSAAAVLRIDRTSTSPRIRALAVTALVRARRGDPDQWALLDEAWALAKPTGELGRLGPVAAARAEAAWLVGDQDGVDAATATALPLAVERHSGMLAGELVLWRRRAGLEWELPPSCAKIYALELNGDCAAAAALWETRGCPYEAALALADADDQELQRQALDELQRLEARPAAAIVARRLRDGGARGLPRGARPETRQNPHGLTPRELEVLGLVAEGLQNSQIAGRLVLSERTVDHHVSAILRKLEVRTRAEAGKEAFRLGLAEPR